MLDLNQMHFALDAAAILICLTIIVFSIINQRTEKAQNRVFITLIVIIGINALCEIATTALEPLRFRSDIAFRLMDYSRLLYFLLHTSLCPVFFYYVACVCGAVTRFNRRQNIFYSAIFIITEIAVLLNPVFHWIYHFDETTRLYRRDWAEIAIYIAAAVYFSLSAMMLLFSWDALTMKRRIALLYFFGIVIIGVAIQLIWMRIKTELFAESLALLGIMLSIETEDDLIDVDTGVYNRRALETDLNTYFVNKRVLQILCVKITNSDLLQRAVGGERGSDMNVLVAGFLRRLLPKYNIYLTGPNTFVLTVFDHTPEELNDLTHTIAERFDEPWLFGDTEFMLSAVVMSANVPLRITSCTDALYMADSPVPAGNEKNILTDSDLDYLMRRAEVEKAVARGLEENNFEVYYQPTYCCPAPGETVPTDKTKYTIHGAEALIRLHDTVLGEIYPTEFIPVAEMNGSIDDVDDLVLREVCEFLKTGVPTAAGMDCINVNLSVIQCMRPGFINRIKGIVESAGIDKKLINFEITETVAANDYKMLSKTINALKREGFMFSMDDYGTGYSNIQSIFSLDFDIVKIDKSILWSAEKGKLGRIILENTVHMIKQMDRKILVEGVETQAQIELLSDIGVDYLQGYYFSRPVPKPEFISIIK